MQTPQYLSQNLKDIIEISGLTIPKFANWLDIKEYTLRNYITRDDINPSFNIMHDISRKLCLYPADLMFHKIDWDKTRNVDILKELIIDPDKYRQQVGNNLFPTYLQNNEPCISRNLSIIISRCNEHIRPITNKDVLKCLNMVGAKLLNLPIISESQFSNIINNKKTPRIEIVYIIAQQLELLCPDLDEELRLSVNDIMVHNIYRDDVNKPFKYIDYICDSLCTIYPFLELSEFEPTLCNEWLLIDLNKSSCSQIVVETINHLNNILKGNDDILLYDCMQKLYIIDNNIYDYYKSLLIYIYPELHFEDKNINKEVEKSSIRNYCKPKEFVEQYDEQYDEQYKDNFQSDLYDYINYLENRLNLILRYFGLNDDPMPIEETETIFINEETSFPFSFEIEMDRLKSKITRFISTNDKIRALENYISDVSALISPENKDAFNSLSEDFLKYYYKIIKE